MFMKSNFIPVNNELVLIEFWNKIYKINDVTLWIMYIHDMAN